MMKRIQKAWEEISSSSESLKDFALVMGTGLIIIGLSQQHIKLIFSLENVLLYGFVVLACGILVPNELKLFQKAWMLLGLGLNYVMSTVLLSIIYLTVIIPTGLFMRVFMKKKVFSEIDRTAQSYWEMRSNKPRSKQYYLKQF